MIKFRYDFKTIWKAFHEVGREDEKGKRKEDETGKKVKGKERKIEN